MKTCNQLCLKMATYWLVLGSVLLAGCKSTGPVPPSPGKLELSVQRNSVIQNTDLYVDVIGVNDADKARLDQIEIPTRLQGDTFLDDLLMRRHAGTNFYFAAGSSAINPQIIPSTDGLWQLWEGQKVTHIVVICDLRPTNKPGRRASVAFDWNCLKNVPKDPQSRKRRLQFEIFQDSIKPPPCPQ